MPKVVVDRRVQKTRQLLKDALIALISEKGFEAVSIQEILDRANVGRSTFYLHFENKQDLLHRCFEDISNLFEQHSAGVSQSDFTLDLFRFVERNHRLFKALLGKDGIVMFTQPIHEYVFTYMCEALKMSAAAKKQASLQSEMLAHYLTSAFIGTLKWWINNDMPCTVEEMDKFFKKFAAHDIKELLE